MSKILVSAVPLAGHVNAMLVIAEFLRNQGHDVLFNISDLFRNKAEAYDCASSLWSGTLIMTIDDWAN
jgi:UDP:flavonoid glycosyltransferase YjiC (YdhE family)